VAYALSDEIKIIYVTLDDFEQALYRL